MHWGINPNPTQLPSFLPSPAPFKSANCPRPLFIGNPSFILFFHETPSKTWIFPWTQKILKFFILTPSYLLKVTKFLVKIFQFEFLNFFVIKYSRFWFIFCRKIAPRPLPLNKVIPLFPSNHPLKPEVQPPALPRPPPPSIPCAHYGRLFHESVDGLCKVFLWSSCVKKLPIKRHTRNIKPRGFYVWAIYFYTFIVTKYWLEHSISPW